MAEHGVPCCGVLAPGVWRAADESTEAALGGGVPEREKIGIDNVLLPEGDRVPFALRRDMLAHSGSSGAASADAIGEGEAAGMYVAAAPSGRGSAVGADGLPGATSQSDRASLGWAIFDDALARVNAHFESLAADCRMHRGAGSESTGCLLVIDELGRLELQGEGGGGLVSALRLLDEGPSPRYPHALVVVRDWLVGEAVERFEPAWGAARIISPDEQAHKAVEAAFSR